MDAHRDWDRVRSLCPECLRVIEGVLRESPAGLVMEKVCPEHGFYQVVVSSDLDTYQRLSGAPRCVTEPRKYRTSVSDGCPNDCGLCPDHDQHTCLAILEVTSRCDLQCPVCLADSSHIGCDLGPSEIRSALTALIEHEGGPCPLQFSGGEPTLHPHLADIVRLAASFGFSKIELDTNGLSLAGDRGMAAFLRDAGLTGVYLQMDGIRASVSEFLRGRDLVEEKVKAVENCTAAGLQVVLSVTVVPGVNDEHLWEMVQFALDHKLTGVNFQGVTVSGRSPDRLVRSPERFTQGHFMAGLEAQSEGKVKGSDFMPIPCPDTRCGLLSYTLVVDGNVIPLKRLFSDSRLMDFGARMSDWEEVIQGFQTQDSIGCGCDRPEPQQNAFRDLLPDADFFSIGYHGMMDAYNIDLERVRRCCIHRLTPDGLLIPFCLYNVKYRHEQCR